MRRQFRSKRKQGGWWQYAAAAAAAAANYLGQKNTNEENVQLGRDQMDFQERMSSTAYQRAVQDMQKAGLNPMLAYSQGGASTPVGSMPQVQNAMGAAVSSAAQTMNMVQGVQQIEQSKAATERIQAETAKIRSETYDREMNVTAKTEQIASTNAGMLLRLQQGLTEAARRGLVENDAELRKLQSQLASIRVDRENTTFADDVAIRKAQRILKESGIPEAQATAKFFTQGEGTGEYNRYIQQLLDVLKLFTAGGNYRGR